MPIDLVGNSTSQASSLGTLSGSVIRKERIGGGDRHDFYSFTLGSHSNFSATLKRLRVNANLSLHDSAGQTLFKSKNKGTGSEFISANLDAGAYYIRVSSRSKKSTAYKLFSNSTQSSYIQVSSPKSGEVLTPGTNTIINWTDNVSENIKIDLFKNGSYYSSINSSTLSDGSETWAVPSNITPGSDYQIRISSATNSNIYDYSDGYFSIASNSYVSVTSPNGGNTFKAGSSQTIAWTDNISENVKIDLYKGGSYYSTISSSTLSDGSETWVIPDNLTPGSDYKIRISSTNNNTLYDESNSVFAIEPNLNIENGFDIEFDYRYDSAGWFTPERRATLEAAASVWKNIILDEFANIPVGTKLLTRNPQTNESVYLQSDKVIDDLLLFVGARDLGETTLGTASSSASIVSSELQSRYYGNDFEPWTGWVAFDTTTNWFFDTTPATDNDIPSNAYDFFSVAVHEIGHVLGIGGSEAYQNWVIDGMFTGPNAKAKNGGNPIPLEYSAARDDYPHIQEGYEHSGDEVALDPSLANGVRKLPTALDIAILDDIGYSVNYQGNSSITVTSPNGSNVFQAGYSQTITWADNISENVSIDLYKGGIYHSAITTSTTSDGNEVWILPTTLDRGTDYQIRITSTTNSNIFDFSDNYFTITEAPFLMLSSPNAGGDSFEAGSGQTIMWTDNLNEDVKIDLYKGGSYHRTIFASTPSDGFAIWSVPTDLAPGSDYQIRISSIVSESIYDYSEGYFTITEAPFITVTSPNGGNVFRAGSSQTISWLDNIHENVRVELYKGEFYHSTIFTSTESDGSEIWMIPENLTPGDDYKIRISGNGIVYDYSDHYFSIYQ